ncbi:YkgJ family cysteine cluster protein [Halieaceae bacterium IMCC14734]|uniref:YkgJ family cysteine cluster protein n=1 Tax=Candidatus Litorirhabdus singularis TaxID=2518993 RepID=A0ABT3TJ36_9GAMM|nr:YkgJ family cysteine cluster protein [Candidatus Litorirhabdus singularis]MCX2982284.1 YkgJ family cysteine cluster protein [Candidatus Litorirhabdus singularis]
MECRKGCGACCIAASINHPLPGMPMGKPAGMVCVNLLADSNLCSLWGGDDYPATCQNFKAELAVCGNDRAEAIVLIDKLELATRS